MANFIPSKHEANEYNNGVAYVGQNTAEGIQGDAVQAKTINNLVESALYSQEVVEENKTIADSAVTVANEALDKIDKFIDKQDSPPPVGYHYIQYAGEATPAQRYAGTSWAIDTDYQGRTIIGAGSSYAFGTTGGSADAVLVNHSHVITKIITSGNGVTDDGGTIQRGYAGNSLKDITNEYGGSGTYFTLSTEGESGAGKNLPPYKVVNVWKRTK